MMEAPFAQGTHVVQRRGELLRWAVPAVLLAGAAVSLFARFRAGGGFLAFFDDDFFYYLRIAQNIDAGRGSTFDGMHLTNGYHPLWMAVIVLLVKLFGGRPFFYVLMLLILLCVLATYRFTAQCLRQYAGEGASRACAALVAADALLIMSGGMEIVLTVPLLALVCWYRVRRFTWTPRRALTLGFLCSILVLSRLDAAIFVALLAGCELAGAAGVPGRDKLRASVAFALGNIPVVLYLVSNRILFGTLMPVSGQAKELRRHHLPSLYPILAALYSWAPLRFFLVLPVLAATVLAVAVLLRRGRERLLPQHRALVAALMAFPLVHLGLIAILSDWPNWPWYLYPFLGSAVGLCLVLFSRSGRLNAGIARFATPAFLASFAGLLAIFSAVQWRNSDHPEKPMFMRYFGSLGIRDFAATHPGIYAMGDGAALPGFLIQQPMVQMEGLVMDQPFLTNIRQQRDLKQTLERYHVRYYIASKVQPEGDCVRVTEPTAAGLDTYKMHSTFCSKPVIQFGHDATGSYIFDMQKELAQTR